MAVCPFGGAEILVKDLPSKESPSSLPKSAAIPRTGDDDKNQRGKQQIHPLEECQITLHCKKNNHRERGNRTSDGALGECRQRDEGPQSRRPTRAIVFFFVHHIEQQ